MNCSTCLHCDSHKKCACEESIKFHTEVNDEDSC